MGKNTKHIRGKFSNDSHPDYDTWAVGSLFHPAIQSALPPITNETPDNVCLPNQPLPERPEHHFPLREAIGENPVGGGTIQENKCTGTTTSGSESD